MTTVAPDDLSIDDRPAPADLPVSIFADGFDSFEAPAPPRRPGRALAAVAVAAVVLLIPVIAIVVAGADEAVETAGGPPSTTPTSAPHRAPVAYAPATTPTTTATTAVPVTEPPTTEPPTTAPPTTVPPTTAPATSRRPAPTTTIAAEPVAAVVAAPLDMTEAEAAFLACLRKRESGGNYQIVSSNGLYFGAYQFMQSTWNTASQGAGRPDLVGRRPNTVAPADQDHVALQYYRRAGSAPWGGACS